ncbi:hypothetical protein [Kitasatospora indigofera]|uniref:hypothetical protein n=1 Tax=Kitasatospora indigofera TaxID=67307 RepID=UPI0036B47B85
MPKQPTDPAAIARTARDAVEALNHATGLANIPAPATSATTQALLSLVQRLPQTVEQLADAVLFQAKRDGIRMDDGSDPIEAAIQVRAALLDARCELGAAADSIQRAASHLFHMAAK